MATQTSAFLAEEAVRAQAVEAVLAREVLEFQATKVVQASRDFWQGKLPKIAVGGMAHGVAENDEHDEEAHDKETSLRGHDGKLIEREDERN